MAGEQQPRTVGGHGWVALDEGMQAELPGSVLFWLLSERPFTLTPPFPFTEVPLKVSEEPRAEGTVSWGTEPTLTPFGPVSGFNAVCFQGATPVA